jgi:hypothetical protein
MTDGPTRDIRLPPLPPPPYHAPDDEPTDRLQPPGDPDRQRTLAFDSPAGDLGQPPFGSPEAVSPAPVLQPPAPVPAPPAGGPEPRPRRWPWVLLVLLPLLVIVGAGLLLARLLGG